MAKKALRKTLPKEFDDLLKQAAVDGDYRGIQAMLQGCVVDARGELGAGQHGGADREIPADGVAQVTPARRAA